MSSGVLASVYKQLRVVVAAGRLRVFANFHAYFIESGVGKQCAQSGTSRVSGLTATSHKYALSTIVSWTDVNKS